MMIATRHPIALAVVVSVIAASPATAADLPQFGRAATPSFIGMAPAHPYFAEAGRFDIYGYPVVREAPNPLYAATGCPALLQPVYDAMGNFAGYSPVQGCR